MAGLVVASISSGVVPPLHKYNNPWNFAAPNPATASPAVRID
jgi:hypothetical protein